MKAEFRISGPHEAVVFLASDEARFTKVRGRLAMVNFWDKNPRDTEPGYYGLAKRNVERGGETLLIVTTLPVMYATVAKLAIEHDQAELRLDPNSDYRYFVVELTEQEIAAHIARHAGS